MFKCYVCTSKVGHPLGHMKFFQHDVRFLSTFIVCFFGFFFLIALQVDCVCHGRLWELPSDPYLAAKEKKIFRRLDSGNDTTTNTIIQRVIENM